MLITKKTDMKGRLVLGPDYANTTVIIEKQEKGNLLIKKAAIIPENEVKHMRHKAVHVIEEPKAEYVVSKKLPTSKESGIKKMRGFLKGIDTTVPRDKDRV